MNYLVIMKKLREKLSNDQYKMLERRVRDALIMRTPIGYESRDEFLSEVVLNTTSGLTGKL